MQITALFGIFSTLIPRVYTHYVSIIVFTIFGLKMLYDGFTMRKEKDVDQQIKEVNDNIEQQEQDVAS